jgi:dTDP-4-dehydrorhamnose 3,5-epimerase
VNLTPLDLPGAWLVTPERIEDERGYFVRTWCRRTFAESVGEIDFVQSSVSFNRHAGTVRGLHFQVPPFSETKLVRCARGALYDVIVDMRRGSPTCGRWLGLELSEENGHALLVPEGFAHGFQTLRDGTEVVYQISQYYTLAAARGIRFDDPSLAVCWPLPVSVISERDRGWPSFSVEQAA